MHIHALKCYSFLRFLQFILPLQLNLNLENFPCGEGVKTTEMVMSLQHRGKKESGFRNRRSSMHVDMEKNKKVLFICLNVKVL